MLVLTRRVGDRIIIQTDQGEVAIVVQRIGTEKIRLGVEAPAELLVLRGELVSGRAA